MNPVIGLFAKEPVPGSVKTRLGETVGMKQAADFYAGSLAWMIKRLFESRFQFDFFFTRESDQDKLIDRYPLLKNVNCVRQDGNNLGEKMLNALCSITERYDRPAILLGSDSPDLPFSYLNEAAQRLSDHEVIIGPAEDGGYYLIGMHDPRDELFENMQWSHQSVLDETVKRIEECFLEYYLLPRWQDYDRLGDLIKRIES